MFILYPLLTNNFVNTDIFVIFFFREECDMSDSQTIKLGSYFVLGIGFVVFLLGLGAYIFY